MTEPLLASTTTHTLYNSYRQRILSITVDDVGEATITDATETPTPAKELSRLLRALANELDAPCVERPLFHTEPLDDLLHPVCPN